MVVKKSVGNIRSLQAYSFTAFLASFFIVLAIFFLLFISFCFGF